MDAIINHGIPHVGEQIFESLENEELIQCLKVSQTWQVLAENILFKRWKGKFFETCEYGKAEIVKILLDRSEISEIDVIARDSCGRTVFMWACYISHKGVVKMLLDHPSGKTLTKMILTIVDSLRLC